MPFYFVQKFIIHEYESFILVDLALLIEKNYVMVMRKFM